MTNSEHPAFDTVTIDPDWKIAIIRSVWYDELTAALARDAKNELGAQGISTNNIRVIDASGSYELPLLAQKALESGSHGVIAFGIVIQGATHHARLVAEQAAAGCMQVQLTLGHPIAFEVIFADSLDTARSRCIGPDAKGALAARTLLTQLAEIRKLRS